MEVSDHPPVSPLRRFHNEASILNVYEARVLPFIEYRTPALFHATATVLRRLHAVQDRFLREIGVAKEDALLHFNLAAPVNAPRYGDDGAHTSNGAWLRPFSFRSHV